MKSFYSLFEDVKSIFRTLLLVVVVIGMATLNIRLDTGLIVICLLGIWHQHSRIANFLEGKEKDKELKDL